ncbi:helix-turn-helix domain-containing protein [Bifidobacterium indicum]|uniref:helix-turn-helix domain-containing protein n=1 Tax=Bifidobacterium indicum TaxID=1691 RepID=UPI0030DCA80E
MSEMTEMTTGNPVPVPAKLLTPAEAAEILVIPVSTLNAWRAQRIELPYVRIGHLVRYRQEDVLALIETNMVRPQ